MRFISNARQVLVDFLLTEFRDICGAMKPGGGGGDTCDQAEVGHFTHFIAVVKLFL